MLPVIIDGENYKVFEEKNDISELAFPTLLNQINLFEKKNPPRKPPTYEFYPLKVVDEKKSNYFDVLLLNEDNKKLHYTYISQKTLHAHKIFSVKGVSQALTIIQRKQMIYI